MFKPWHALGDPLSVRLRHLKPGTRAFASNLNEVRAMVDAATAEHRAALASGKKPDTDAPLFAAEAQGVRA